MSNARTRVEWGYRNGFHGQITAPTSGFWGAVEQAALEAKHGRDGKVYRREVIETPWVPFEPDQPPQSTIDVDDLATFRADDHL